MSAQPVGQTRLKRSLLLTGRLLAHSVPLMLLLFIVMPRIGSFWAVPLQKHAATTGVSDSMSPGDFSSLTRSGGVAFRVTFDGDPPPANQLYWRGLVFSQFDGRTWQADQITMVLISPGGRIGRRAGSIRLIIAVSP